MNENGFSYRLFTISDLQDWLFHNANNGLSEAVISRPRALAFVNDPHALPEDPALAVVFNEQYEPVGYTGAFAERWVKPALPDRYFWGSTQWMEPQYRGKGISWKMMRQIKDAVSDHYIALESSIASCRLDEKQGSMISYYPRYYILLKCRRNTLKCKLKDWFVLRSVKKALASMNSFDYSNRYVNWIDDETYAFIVAHSNHDLFLREQDYLNWQLRNPFFVSTGYDGKLEADKCEFGGIVSRQQTIQVKVFVEGKLCGYYVLNLVGPVCSVLYLYYEKAFSNQVFASLATVALKRNNVEKIRSFNKDLVDFMKKMGIRSVNSKDMIDQVSLTVPSGFVVDASLSLQGGDGDMV